MIESYYAGLSMQKDEGSGLACTCEAHLTTYGGVKRDMRRCS